MAGPRSCSRRAAAALLAAALAGVLWPAVPGAAQPLGPQSVEDLQGRFTISVPPAWEVERSKRDPAVSAKSPAPNGALADTVNVFVRDLGFPISAQECAYLVKRVMRFTIHRWTTLREGPDNLAGLPAYSHLYVWTTQAGWERRSMETCVMMGRRAFVLIGTIDNGSSHADHDLADVTRIMGTFHPLTGAPEQMVPPKQGK